MAPIVAANLAGRGLLRCLHDRPCAHANVRVQSGWTKACGQPPEPACPPRRRGAPRRACRHGWGAAELSSWQRGTTLRRVGARLGRGGTRTRRERKAATMSAAPFSQRARPRNRRRGQAAPWPQKPNRNGVPVCWQPLCAAVAYARSACPEELLQPRCPLQPGCRRFACNGGAAPALLLEQFQRRHPWLLNSWPEPDRTSA